MEKRQFLKTYKGHEIYVTDDGKFTTILYNGLVGEVKVSESTLKNLTSEIDNFGLLIGIEYYVIEPFAGSIEKGVFNGTTTDNLVFSFGEIPRRNSDYHYFYQATDIDKVHIDKLIHYAKRIANYKKLIRKYINLEENYRDKFKKTVMDFDSFNQ